jgi:hypothetical protein
LGHAGLQAEKKRKGEMGRVRGKREGEKGGFEFSFLFFKLLNLNSFQNLNTSSLFKIFKTI